MRILAVDPGPTESAYALLDSATRRPLVVAKLPNAQVAAVLEAGDFDLAVVEMVASYGMAVGAEVFETCVWIGRFVQIVAAADGTYRLIKRPDVKMHHCHNRGAKDSNVRSALVERFAYAQPNFGKGTKKSPGFFYGFSADVWQAYAVGVKAADDIEDCQLPLSA